MIDSSEKVQVIDSHTAGEPTRVVLDGTLKLGSGTMVELRDRFQENGDWLRSSLLSEPRGFEAMVGALLCESLDSRCEAGVVFFNNAGVLKGCLHGTMGLIKTLELMLDPKTAEELNVIALAWRDSLKETIQQISDLGLKDKISDEDKKNSDDLIDKKEKLLTLFRIVISELENKGGDLRDLKSYADAVSKAQIAVSKDASFGAKYSSFEVIQEEYLAPNEASLLTAI